MASSRCVWTFHADYRVSTSSNLTYVKKQGGATYIAAVNQLEFGSAIAQEKDTFTTDTLYTSIVNVVSNMRRKSVSLYTMSQKVVEQSFNLF